jgi:hypothetical protein
VASEPELVISDDDGTSVGLPHDDAAALLALTGGLDGATVSACPDCRSRVLAALAFVDLLDAAAPHSRQRELVELADDAPTAHLYVVDRAADCGHHRWHDPGFEEWSEVVGDAAPRPRR